MWGAVVSAHESEHGRQSRPGLVPLVSDRPVGHLALRGVPSLRNGRVLLAGRISAGGAFKDVLAQGGISGLGGVLAVDWALDVLSL